MQLANTGHSGCLCARRAGNPVALLPAWTPSLSCHSHLSPGASTILSLEGLDGPMVSKRSRRVSKFFFLLLPATDDITGGILLLFNL